VNAEWINVGVSIGLLIAFGIHFALTFHTWRKERSARSLRNLYLAAMIEVAMVSFVFGAAGRLNPSLTDVARFVGGVVRGMLIIGALVVLITWRVQPDVHRESRPRG
jgi:hypothetical protein